MHSPLKPGIPSWQLFVLAILFLTLGIWLAAATSVLIMQAANAGNCALGEYLIEEGAAKVMRRCLLGIAIVFLIFFLRRAGWQGWKDCGLTTTDPQWSWHPWHAGLLNGIILGILTMGAVATLTTLAGIHRVYVTASLPSVLLKIAALLVSALVIGFFEEIVVRGILFRVLARIGRAWPAAVLSSLIFATAHFIEPAPEAFTGASFLSTTNAVFTSTFTMFGKIPNLTLRFVNLSLLGIVLCAFVIRTGTIWMSIGAHVAWVWMIKTHSLITMFYPPAPLIVWLGKRNDFMDSILATGMLSGLLAWTLLHADNGGQPLRRNGRKWRVAPGELARFVKWLAGPGRATDPEIQESPGRGRVLKAYDGCRVTALDGMVWKEYRPVHGWRGWRFGLRPSRTRRSFLIGQRLAKHGIPTPTPVAWAIERRFGLRRADHGITVELTETEELTNWLGRQAKDPALRAAVMAAYGRLAAAFHCNGFFNRDLKHENVLCAAAHPAQLWVVDLDGVRWRGWITRRRTARDLRRVGLCLASAGWSGPDDTAAFFKAYNAIVPARLQRDYFPDSRQVRA